MKKIIIPLGVMGVSSTILILALSILTYIWKWKADTALIGITFIYMLAGFLGGVCKKRISDEGAIGKKLLEGIVVGSLFAIILFVISVFGMKNAIIFDRRFFVVWMVIIGSCALGSILKRFSFRRPKPRLQNPFQAPL